jgi:hypothetical protein
MFVFFYLSLAFSRLGRNLNIEDEGQIWAVVPWGKW